MRRLYPSGLLRDKPGMSSRELSRQIVSEALIREPHERAGDDVTCAVMYFRSPRKLMVLCGPPFSTKREGTGEYARMLKTFPGKGKPSAAAPLRRSSRESSGGISLPTSKRPGEVCLPYPPWRESILSRRDGLSRSARRFSTERTFPGRKRPRRDWLLLVESDRIRFVVGTRVTRAHQIRRSPWSWRCAGI